MAVNTIYGHDQRCAENWAPIVDIPNFGSFLPQNWVGVGLWVSIYQNWGQITPISTQNCGKIGVVVDLDLDLLW